MDYWYLFSQAKKPRKLPFAFGFAIGGIQLD
jgi:hypothetical protein